MARLTRTQKFATLREELANSSEEEIVNNDLNKFKNKLDSLKDASENKKEDYDIKLEPLPTFNEITKEIKEEEVPETKIEDAFLAEFDFDNINDAIDKIVKQNVEILGEDKLNKTDEFKPVLDDKKEEVENIFQQVKNIIPSEEHIEDLPENHEIKVDDKVSEENNASIKEDTIVIDKQDDKELETSNEINNKTEENNANNDTNIPSLESKKEVEEVKPLVIPQREEEPFNYIEQNYEDIASLLKKELIELNGVIEPLKETKKELEIEDLNLKPVNKDIIKDNLEVKLDIPDIAKKNESEIEIETQKDNDKANKDISSLLDSTLKEIATYNNQAGRMTVEQISNDLIEEVRHNNYTNDKEDEEFSNTITLEIDKVLNEIKAEPTSSIDIDNVLDNTSSIKPIEISSKDAATKLADKINLNDLKDNKENVVDIKSIDETFTNNIVDDTKTLSFKKDDIDDDDNYYYDDDKPNKVLNIVIIILMVIFLIIVGIIIYFFLLAKGIL